MLGRHPSEIANEPCFKMVCGKVMCYCPFPSWDRASQQVGPSRTQTVLPWTKHCQTRWLAWAVLGDGRVTQSVLAAAANFLSVLAYISTLGRDSNLTLFHPAITPNTAPIERMKHPDVTALGSPNLTATQVCCAVSPVGRKLSAPFHISGHPPTHQMQSWRWPGFEQTPCGKARCAAVLLVWKSSLWQLKKKSHTALLLL